MSEIRTFGLNSPRGGIVVTETGYLMLVKSFTDDLAWAVQRQLVNTYFRAKSSKPQQIKMFIPKYYNGEPVVTVRDIVETLGIAEHIIRPHIKKLVQDVDFYVLYDEMLARFKADNPCIEKTIPTLTVITHSGFNKLARLIRGIAELPCFANALPEAKKEEKEAEEKSNSSISLQHLVSIGLDYICALMKSTNSLIHPQTAINFAGDILNIKEKYNKLGSFVQVLSGIDMDKDNLQMRYYD